MQARTFSRDVYRQVFDNVKQRLPWMSGRTLHPRCRFSGTSILPGSQERSIIDVSRGAYSLLSKVGQNFRGAEVVMVSRVEGLGGLRGMGFTNRPTDRTSQHGGMPLPKAGVKNEERHTDAYLLQARKMQQERVKQTEQVVSGVAGQSLAAADTETVNTPGNNQAELQSEIEFDDLSCDNLAVDEEVKRGLVADSALPMGRIEKKAEAHVDDEDVERYGPGEFEETKDDVSDHGTWKVL